MGKLSPAELKTAVKKYYESIKPKGITSGFKKVIVIDKEGLNFYTVKIFARDSEGNKTIFIDEKFKKKCNNEFAVFNCKTTNGKVSVVLQ